MALSNGGYVMVPASGVGLALDTQGATTTNGANVRLYIRRASAGQLVTVQTYGSHRIIRFTLTGMVCDVKGGTPKAGANVQQYTWNKGLNQQWDMVESGTATIDGTSYPTYYVRSAKNDQYEMGVVGSSASRANIQLEARSTSADHRWAFVPTKLLQGGIPYRLISASSSSVCVGLSGKKGDAQAQLVGVADSDLQRWLAVDMGSQYLKLESLSSRGTYLTPKGLAASSSNPVTVQKATTDTSQQWRAVIVGSKAYNGQQVPLVEIFNRETPSQALDVKGASTEIGTKLQTYTSSGANSQRFLAIPESSLSEGLPAPTELGVTDAPGKAVRSQRWGTGRTNCHPCWVGSSDSWELRYRTRERKATAGDTTYTAWTPWRTPSGSQAWQGWGTGEAATCRTTSLPDPSGKARRYANAIPITVSTTGADRVEVQYQVRRWGGPGAGGVPTHGQQANRTFAVIYRPTLTVEGVTWNPEGLHVRYHSDQRRGGNTLTAYRVTETRGGRTYVLLSREAGYPVQGLAYAGVALIPQARLRRVPQEGSTITIDCIWDNVDGANMPRATYSGTLSYDTGRNLDLDPEITEPAEANGWMLGVRAKDSHGQMVQGDSFACFIDYGDEVERYDSSDGEWSIPVRFGAAYTLHVMAQSGTRWDNDVSSHPAVDSPGIVLNTSDSCFVVAVNLGGIPLRSHSAQADWDAQTTNAGGYERVHVGEGTSAPGTIQGVHRPGDGTAWTSCDIAEAMVGQYAWLRDYGGRRRRVVVVGLDRTKRDRGNEQFVLSYRQVDEPGEW